MSDPTVAVAARPSGAPRPRGTRGLVLMLLACLGIAAVITAVTGVVLMMQPARYTARVTVELVPASNTDGQSLPKYISQLSAGRPTKTALAVIGDTATPDAATKNGHLAPGAVMTASSPDGQSITLMATAGTAADAEAAAAAYAVAAKAAVEPVAGPYTLTTIGTPAGTAVRTGVPVALVLLTVGPASFLVCLGAAIAISRLRAQRREAETAAR